MAGWTDRDLPELTGRTALVTGANSGLGLQTSLGLARAGARVLLAARDAARGKAALERVRAEVPGADAELVGLDLADLSSVQTTALAVSERVPRLDLLVNNAGVMALPPRLSADRFELQLATNHLGHFALTGRLLPLLMAAPAPRVVTVSSQAHRFGRIDFDDLQSTRRYDPWRAYGQSKLANLLFSAELQRRADAAGVPLTSAAAHPGLAATQIQRPGQEMAGRPRLGSLMTAVSKVVAQGDRAGSWPVVYAASMSDVGPDDYLGPGGPFEWRGHPRHVGRAPAARDVESARRLWEESERLTDVAYAWPATAGAAG
jgi:NAD(P)-dependent dehydrogenase (short-subunit alcohol dehydrogenase family)